MSATDGCAIGVDIGGTKIAFALVNRDGRVLDKYQLPTNAAKGSKAVVDAVAAGVQLLKRRSAAPVLGVGVGVPGFVDREQGIVRDAVNLGWREMPLGRELKAATGLSVTVQNDVNALLEGELRFGAAQGCKTVALAAVGTGLGGALAVDGVVVNGATGSAGEIGHMAIMPPRRQCRCGLYGCVEAYLSGVGLGNGIAEHAHEYPGQSAGGRSPALGARGRQCRPNGRPAGAGRHRRCARSVEIRGGRVCDAAQSRAYRHRWWAGAGAGAAACGLR